MKKDIIERPSTGVEVVIAPRPEDMNGQLWDVWLVNHNGFPLTNILISSRGYGLVDGREKETATLRHFVEELDAKSSHLVEPIQTAIFGITNEYWLSYNVGTEMLEKKFIFLPNTIAATALCKIDVLEREGVTV
ncbi:hypothetical protein CEQ90_10815 [Lewinellaceae bacterium SD302]|nr:hypothetical protein CEQ90_10815 [Lewinellaceae bacterium SD302]